MKRLAAAAIYGSLLLGMTPTARAEPQQEEIRQWYCDAREHVYVQTQGTPRQMVGQCTSNPNPHPQTCWEIKITYADGRWSDVVRCSPPH